VTVPIVQERYDKKGKTMLYRETPLWRKIAALNFSFSAAAADTIEEFRKYLYLCGLHLTGQIVSPMVISSPAADNLIWHPWLERPEYQPDTARVFGRILPHRRAADHPEIDWEARRSATAAAWRRIFLEDPPLALATAPCDDGCGQ
jgi:hypothetical protein